MRARQRFILYSVVYWLLFAVMTYVLITLRFVHDIRPLVTVYDIMGITSHMPPGLRTLMATVQYWWAYLLFGVVMYIGVCSKLRRHSWRMHLSTGCVMVAVSGAWGYVWYWLEYVLPTIK